MVKSKQANYEEDFYAWALHNAQLLREKKLTEVDIKNIAEEIESMGKSEKRELMNRLAILLAHLLKWKFQPVRRSSSWKYTIKEQRIRLHDLLEESPSLKNALEDKIAHVYEHAVVLVVGETGLSETALPDACPFLLAQLLDKHFFPE